MDKANSYPADKVYQAEAYKRAADSIVTYEYDIKDYIKTHPRRWSVYGEIPNVGKSIHKFIVQFVKNNPSKPVAPVSNSKDEPGFCIKVNPDYKGFSIDYKTKEDLIPFMKDLITQSGLTPSDLFDAAKPVYL
jgi:DNA polymerase/3'-5' exonuclease PolX